MSTPGQRFRQAVAAEKPLQVVGAINAYAARLAEHSGFKALYLSGGGVAASSCGIPDLGITTLEDVLIDARRITDNTDLPLLVDIDTGWGGAFNIARAVRSLEKAGVAAVHIEDQTTPKRCGHIAGKQIVSREKAKARFEAAVDAKQSEDTVVIARTDAYGSSNGDWDEHVERGRIYADAGVDIVWPEMPNPSREDAVAYAEEIHETHPDLKLAFNYSSSFAWSEEEDPLTFQELGDLGYKYIFITLFGLHSGAHAVYEDFKKLAEQDEEGQFDLEQRYLDHPTESHHELSFVSRYQDIETEFDPEARRRIEESEGFSEEQADPITSNDDD